MYSTTVREGSLNFFKEKRWDPCEHLLAITELLHYNI